MNELACNICYEYRYPIIAVLMAVCDFVIFGNYMRIPVQLNKLRGNKSVEDIVGTKNVWTIYGFINFIFWCGITHLTDIIMLVFIFASPEHIIIPVCTALGVRIVCAGYSHYTGRNFHSAAEDFANRPPLQEYLRVQQELKDSIQEVKALKLQYGTSTGSS